MYTMTLDSLIMFAGAVIAIIPVLGFPSTWDRPLFFTLGICVVALGVVVRRRLSQKVHSIQPLPDDTDTKNG